MPLRPAGLNPSNISSLLHRHPSSRCLALAVTTRLAPQPAAMSCFHCAAASRAYSASASTPAASIPSSTSGSSTLPESATSQLRPAFSTGAEDVPALTARLAALLGGSPESAGGGGWVLTADGRGVEKSFRFRTFAKAWSFMNAVASQCAVEKHHPEWSNVYNTTFIRWTTHSPRGLSAKDISMAGFCDTQAALFGDVAGEPGDADKTKLAQGLADTVAVAGGDCCVPKSKRAQGKAWSESDWGVDG